MDFSLRPATRKDFAAIRRLIWRVHINPTGLDWRRFIVAVDESDRLLGCGQIKPHADGSRELASIATQPEMREMGIARAIISHLLAENAPPLFLTCAAPLESFYQRFGFVVLSSDAMPPELLQRWRWVDWIKRRLAPKMRGMLVMRWG